MGKAKILEARVEILWTDRLGVRHSVDVFTENEEDAAILAEMLNADLVNGEAIAEAWDAHTHDYSTPAQRESQKGI
jgi:hypothetical protein